MTSHDTGSAPLDEAFATDSLERLRTIFNAHDLDAFTSLMAEDVVFEHPWAGSLHGPAEIRAFYARFWKAFPDLAVEAADGPSESGAGGFHQVVRVSPHGRSQCATSFEATGNATAPGIVFVHGTRMAECVLARAALDTIIQAIAQCHGDVGDRSCAFARRMFRDGCAPEALDLQQPALFLG